MKSLPNPSSQKKTVGRTGQLEFVMAFALAMLSGIGGTARAQSPALKRTIVRPGRVLDVRTGQMRANQAIVIEGDKIAQVVTSGEVKTAAGDTRTRT
jgi:hypothetical protein